MSFSIDGAQPNAAGSGATVTNTGPVPPNDTGSARDVLVESGASNSFTMNGEAAGVGQIPGVDNYFTVETDGEISDYIEDLQTSQQTAQESNSSNSSNSAGSSSTENTDAAFKAASELDDAWAEFEKADPEAKDFVKIQQRVQKALQFFQMALQIMNAVFEAKKAASQGIRY